MSRKPWDIFFLGLAETWAGQSTCTRKQVGAVFAHGTRMLTQGYNGAPPGHPHCTEIGCNLHPVTGGCMRAVHAELNALFHAHAHRIDLKGATAYLTLSPCQGCATLLVQHGISRVVYREAYRDPAPIIWLREAGVICEHRSTQVPATKLKRWRGWKVK